MLTIEESTTWSTAVPDEWPAAPVEMTVFALSEIEACPRRWALTSADYPQIWARRGYPPRLLVSGLAGSVVHLALETIMEQLIRARCSSVNDPAAAQVMRDLGGYATVIASCIDKVLARFVHNPRATRLFENARSSLRTQIADIRTRTQRLLSLARLPPVSGEQARSSGLMPRAPLVTGTYQEIALRARRIGWKGWAGLLTLSDEACEILDFKTGARAGAHTFQVRVSALLWSLDEDLNPSGRLVDTLRLAYESGDVEVATPSSADLAEVERELVARRDVAERAVAVRPPEARPSASICHDCRVRHLCDDYWATKTHDHLARRTRDSYATDMEMTITGRRGPSSWDAVVGVAQGATAGTPVVVRSTRGDLDFRSGNKLRVLDAVVTEVRDDEAEPAVVTLNTLGEVFTVTNRDE